MGNNLKYPATGNHYEVLGISPFSDVSPDELDRRKQKRQTYFHKELGASPEGDEVKKLLNRAANELKNPHKKAAYDSTLKETLFLELDGMIRGAVLDDRKLSSVEENMIFKHGLNRGLSRADISKRVENILKAEKAVRTQERRDDESHKPGRKRQIHRIGAPFNYFRTATMKTDKKYPFRWVLIMLAVYGSGLLIYVFATESFSTWSIIGIITGVVSVITGILMIHNKSWFRETFEEIEIFFNPLLVAWIILFAGSGIIMLSSKSLFYSIVPLYLITSLAGLISKQYKLPNLAIQVISIAAVIFSAVLYLARPSDSLTRNKFSDTSNSTGTNQTNLVPVSSKSKEYSGENVLEVFGSDREHPANKKDRKGIFAAMRNSGPEISTSRQVYLTQNTILYAGAGFESDIISEIEAPASIRVFKEMSSGEWYYGRYQNEFGWIHLSHSNAHVGMSLPCKISPERRTVKAYELPSVYASIRQSVDSKDTVYFVQNGPGSNWGEVQISGQSTSCWIKLDNLEIIDE